MNGSILHLLDATTSPDALEMLGTLLQAQGTGNHHVLVIGHAATVLRAIEAGVPATCIDRVHSMGSWDPTGWRGVQRHVQRTKATMVHAWGFGGLVAASALRLPVERRIATFTMEPTAAQQRWLPRLARRASWLWLAGAPPVALALTALANGGATVETVAPAILRDDRPVRDAAQVREALGIRPGDGPIVLLGGEMAEAGARQAYGLWAAVIAQQIFPRLRILVHTGQPQPFDWRREMLSIRQLGATAADPELIMYADPAWHWRDVLQVADVFLLTPDRAIQQRGVLWAMAAGVPVVATATPQMQSLLEPGKTALIAQPGKPRVIAARLDEVLSDGALAARLGAAAQAHARRQFAAEHLVAELQAIYAAQGVGRRAVA